MRILTLIENLVYQRNLCAEHGLSFYMETGNRKIIIDTGQGINFIHNANILGIDLMAVDTVVITHGHYDHIGGLYEFLKINHKARVFLKKAAFYPKFHGIKSFIGVHYNDILNNRVNYVEETMEIDDGVFIMPEIPIVYPEDTHFNQFLIETEHGFVDDTFDDELFLAITRNHKLSVISSCSHRGITNIIEAAAIRFNLPLDTVLGGFHIMHSNTGQINALLRYLKKLSPRALGIGHCTGVEKYAELTAHLPDAVFYNFTGNTVIVNE